MPPTKDHSLDALEMFDLFEEGIIIARVFVHVFFCAFALALLFFNADDVQQNYFQFFACC